MQSAVGATSAATFDTHLRYHLTFLVSKHLTAVFGEHICDSVEKELRSKEVVPIAQIRLRVAKSRWPTPRVPHGAAFVQSCSSAALG